MSEHIGHLKNEFPELFEDLPLPPINWDDYDTIEVDPSGRIFNDIDIGDIFNPNVLPDRNHWPANTTSDDHEQGTDKTEGNSYGGTLISHNPTTGLYPPPDSLAFYMPYHYFYPNWWGVYILYEGLEQLAKYIYRTARPCPTPTEAIKAAHLFLYYHEAFHHRVECFANRFELIDRRPHFRKGFQTLYDVSKGTNNCLEEALANATATREVSSKLKNRAIDAAILDYMMRQPPGYNQAYLYLENGKFTDGRNKFAELNRSACFGGLPIGDPSFWGSAGHLFDGSTNINSKINYLVPKGAPINGRLTGIRPALTPLKLERKLKKLVGLQHLRSGSRHEIFKTSSGCQIPIPRHNKDLKKGLILGILKKAGLNMSWEEFQRT